MAAFVQRAQRVVQDRAGRWFRVHQKQRQGDRAIAFEFAEKGFVSCCSYVTSHKDCAADGLLVPGAARCSAGGGSREFLD